MNKLNIIKQKINEQIKNEGGIILISDISRQWLTNLKTSFGYLLINANDEQIFITDSRYELVAKNTLKDSALIWIIGNEPEKTLKNLINKAIEKLNIKELLFEEEYISFNDYELIKFIPTKNIKARELRIIKTNKEIDFLQKAADITVETINWVFTWIKPGMTEKEVAKRIAIKVLELGASCNSFDTIVAANKNGAIPHHRPTDYVIQEGDMVTIDSGCIYKDFASDMTRTIIVGKKANNPEMVEIYNIVHEAQLNGLNAAKVGSTTFDVDFACRNNIENTKYNGLFKHGTGHGVGLEVHELPVVSPKTNVPLINNHVITVEPGIYLPNIGGVRIEDTVVIKDGKLLNLTEKCSKELKFIDNN